MNKPGAARHVCRFCSFIVNPSARAHEVMARHVATDHRAELASPCSTTCGFRATPSEGRYTPAPHLIDPLAMAAADLTLLIEASSAVVRAEGLYAIGARIETLAAVITEIQTRRKANA